MTDFPLISVVLPARNEEVALPGLIAQISEVLAAVPHEIVVVDDGSTDGTAAAILACVPGTKGLRLLRHSASCGQSAALRTGILAAKARVIATLDADGQNLPLDLPGLVVPLLDPDTATGLGLVQGERGKRQDRWPRRIASRIANGIRNALLRDGVRDSGCGIKAFPREVYLALPYFDHIHRFMPSMVRREGYRVLTIEVGHASGRGGRSNYSNLQRAAVGVFDLLGTAWLLRRRRLAVVEEVFPEALVSRHLSGGDSDVSRSPKQISTFQNPLKPGLEP
jgi:dolichol-phosphate mannosyltransferase